MAKDIKLRTLQACPTCNSKLLRWHCMGKRREFWKCELVICGECKSYGSCDGHRWVTAA